MGLGEVILPNRTIRRGSGGIEVAEGGETETLRDRQVAERAFHIQFGLPVGVDRVLWEILGHRHLLGHAIGRAGTREDHPADLFGEHRIEQLFRPADVMLVITLRLAHGFADIGEASEMHDDLDGLLAQHQADIRFIGHVEPHERHARRDGGRMPWERSSSTTTRCPAATACRTQ